jgi:hypothetical protein
MIWFGPVFLAVVLATTLGILASLPRAEVGGYVGLPVFLWAGTSIGWLATITSAVRVRPEALVIDRRLNVPWRALVGFLLFFEAFSWISFAIHGRWA